MSLPEEVCTFMKPTQRELEKILVEELTSRIERNNLAGKSTFWELEIPSNSLYLASS